jgi:Protein of unknown function (DUF982)
MMTAPVQQLEQFDALAIFLSPVRHHVRDMASAYDVLMAWPDEHRGPDWAMAVRAYRATNEGIIVPSVFREALAAAARVAGILHSDELTASRQRTRAMGNRLRSVRAQARRT